MDPYLVLFLVVIIFAVIIGAIIIIERRPKFLYKIQNRELFSYRQKTITNLKNKGYLIKEKKKGNVFVQKDNFSATTLVFKQVGSDVDISYIHSNSTLMLFLIIVLTLGGGVFGIFLAVLADSRSNEFRIMELKPLLEGYDKNKIYCPNCGRHIPSDSCICPYCGKILRE